MSTRKAFVAGQFYPADPARLASVVSEYLRGEATSEEIGSRAQRALAIMAPHAGYIYSGAVAGTAYSAAKVPDTLVLIGPNHTGLGDPAALPSAEAWQSPLGDIDIDQPLTNLIEASHRLFTFDDMAHKSEHSLEVQLPFIQFINPKASIVPITVNTCDIDECQELGTGLASAIKTFGKDVLIVVSSDMNHYESDRVTREKDQMAIAQCLRLDSRALLEVCRARAVTMCGAVPMALGMIAAKELGAESSILTGYATSGEVSQDTEQVVGYAGVMIR